MEEPTAAVPHSQSRKLISRRFGVLLLLFALVTGIGLFLWSRQNPSEAFLKRSTLSVLEQAATHHPDDFRTYLYLGRAREKAGNVESAYDAYTHAADLNPDDTDSWLASARLAQQINGYQGGFDLISLFLKHHPDDARAHLALADLYLQKQAYTRARTEALAAATSDPKSGEAWYIAGVSAGVLGASAEAERSLRQAIAAGATDWRYPMMLANTLAEQHRYLEAQALAAKAVALAPNQGMPYLTLGKIQLAQAKTLQDLATARHTLERSIALLPTVTTPLLLIARSDAALGKWQEARAELERAARLAPQDPSVLFELLRVDRRLGDHVAVSSIYPLYRQAGGY
jgi:tetratricopeptide (TPR) repeat protein